MCYVCCKEFKGWCKSFTRIEAVLLALEALLLLVLIGSVVFLTLHLIVCSNELKKITHETQDNTNPIKAPKIPPRPSSITRTPALTVTTTSVSVSRSTLSPDVECTWTPSHKTEATTHYYWIFGQEYATNRKTPFKHSKSPNDPKDSYVNYDRDTDGSDAPQMYKNYVAALVKLKPPEQVTFGCILTKVTRYWALTAASCIESIEEMESLDSFFIMDSYGMMEEGRSHAVVDVQIHPLYQGANRSYDLAALRSENVLIPSRQLLLQVPTLLEYFVVAVGERFTILGYGGYRSLDRTPTGRRLREVSTYTVSLAQCSEEGKDVWTPRHLSWGDAMTAGSCGAPGTACGAHALCAGSLHSRAAPCSFCGGTPLLRDAKLYGIMAQNRHCGVACEPTLYVNVAAQRDWLDSVIST